MAEWAVPASSDQIHAVARCKQAALFLGISEKEISQMCPLLGFGLRRYEKGVTLVRIDNVVNDIGILLSGRLDIFKEDMHGNLLLLREVSAYEVYTAEIVCMPTRVSPLNIFCKTDVTIMTFPYDGMHNSGVLPDAIRCKLLKNLLAIVANANIRQLYKIDILSKKSLRERICMYLAIQQKKKSSSFSLSLNREELACYLCVDRSALSRELSRMQKEGLIRYKKNRFEILSGLH